MSIDKIVLSVLSFSASTDCSRQMVLQLISVNSTWEKDGLESDWSFSHSRSVSQTGIWDNESDSKRWLQLDLGEKKRITG